jgi:2,3-bisphosphoglycerate-dependent phosphoglycerate mutase
MNSIKKYTVGLLLALLTISNTGFSQNNATVIYLVRHAEKDTSDPNAPDPLLTEAGKQRAAELAKLLDTAKIAAVFSTDRIRTRETGKPLADKNKLTLQLYDPRDTQLAKKILETNAGKKVLIIGHSNTLIPLILQFGAQPTVTTIADHEHDNLFIVTIKPDGIISLESRKFGMASVSK